jgi:hypothetical protein
MKSFGKTLWNQVADTQQRIRSNQRHGSSQVKKGLGNMDDPDFNSGLSKYAALFRWDSFGWIDQ